jgi:hypothetical protein
MLLAESLDAPQLEVFVVLAWYAPFRATYMFHRSRQG